MAGVVPEPVSLVISVTGDRDGYSERDLTDRSEPFYDGEGQAVLEDFVGNGGPHKIRPSLREV